MEPCDVVHVTILVHGMTAWHLNARRGRGMHVSKANHAILFHGSRHASMSVLLGYRQAAAAFVTMKEVILASSPTYTAFFAMEDAFAQSIIVVKIASGAKVF